MADEAIASQEITVVEGVESNGVNYNKIEEGNDNKTEETTKEDETTVEGEFIKVEKESLDCSAVATNPEVAREFLESQEKVKDLKNELHRVSTENAHLEDELLQTKEKLLEVVEKHEELELSNKNLRKCEELYKQSSLHAEAEKTKALEFETLFKAEKVSAKETEKKMASLKDEVKSLSDKVSENKKLEEALKSATAELDNVRGELENSRLEAKEVEQRLASKEALISELTQELEFTKSAEAKSRKDFASLENLLVDFKTKLKKEVDAKEIVEELLKEEESKIKIALEVALEVSMEKLTELNSHLSLANEENESLKEISKTSNEKLSETETLLSITENELIIKHKRLESIEKDLKASEVWESELKDKLKYAEEQLELQGEILEEATAKSAELKSSYEIIWNFISRDTEAIIMHEKMESLENQVSSYVAQLTEANECYETAIKELGQVLVKLVLSEGINEELKRRVLEDEGKVDLFFSENAILAEKNAGLVEKVKDLEEKSILNNSEVKDLFEKIKAFEAQVCIYEEQAWEASDLVKSRELELENFSVKSKDLESKIERKYIQYKETEELVEANLNLTEELGSFKSELSDLQMKYLFLLLEKDYAANELNAAKKDIEELTQKLVSEGKQLQSQISYVMGENNLLKETFESSRRDIQTIIINLEEQLREQKSNKDALKAKLEDVGHKADLENHEKEIEEQLAKVEGLLQEEEGLSSKQDMEWEVCLKDSYEDQLETKKNEILLLVSLVEDLEQKLEHAKSKEKDAEGASSELKDEAKKSRIVSSYAQVHTAINLKFVLAVAVVPIVVGAILGKSY